MKKTTFITAGMCLFLLTGCLSPKIVNFDYKEKAAQGTPENSVIFIGFYGNNGSMYWSQCNSAYQPDYQQLEGPYIVSAPVAPGSRYRLEYVSGSMTVGRTTYYWNDTYPMQDNSFDIKIPEEPGVYFFGYYNGQNSFQQGVPVQPAGLFATTNPVKQQKECLEAALRIYKGTEWEAAIKEKLEELK